MAFNLGDIFVTFKAKAEGFAAAVGQVQNAANQVQGVTDKIGKFGDQATRTGKTMSLALTTPIIGFGVAAFKSAADFERTMNQVAAATGEPKASMKELTDLAMKMGAETAYSAGEAADAMLELSKGGLTAAQIKAGALQATMTLAAAGGIALASAAGYVSNSLNTFGLGADQAGNAAAALAGGANASTASIDSLGQALSQVGPGAKLAGYSLQDTVAVLAAFDNAGVKGSDAGTSLKTMLMNLTPQTKAAADQMAALGLKFTDAQGKFIPIRDVAEQLRTKLAGLSDSQKQNALQTMFGTDAYRAAAILMNEGAAGVDKYSAATNDLGAAQKMADANMAGSAGSIERMMGSIETAVQKAGEVIAPTIIKVMDKIGEWADKFGALDPKVQSTILIVMGIVAAIGPLLIILGMLANGIRVVGAAFAFLAANPVVLAIIAIILVIAGLAYLIITNWSTLQEWMGAFWQWLTDIASGVWTAIMEGLQAVGDFFTAIWDAIKGVVLPIFDAIKFAAQILFAIIMALVVVNLIVWTAIFNVFGAVVGAIWGAIKAAAIWVFDIISAYIRFVIGVWTAIFNTIVGALTGPFNTAWNWIKSVFGGIGAWFGGVIDGIRGTFNRVVDIISGPFKSAFNAIAGFWNNSIGSLKWKAPDWVPGIGGKEIGVPKLPMLAQGGIVDRATMAVIGEGNEPEAVIPLSKIGQVASQMGVGGDGGGTHITFEISGVMARSETELRDILQGGLESLDQRRIAQGKKPLLG